MCDGDGSNVNERQPFEFAQCTGLHSGCDCGCDEKRLFTLIQRVIVAFVVLCLATLTRRTEAPARLFVHNRVRRVLWAHAMCVLFAHECDLRIRLIGSDVLGGRMPNRSLKRFTLPHRTHLSPPLRGSIPAQPQFIFTVSWSACNGGVPAKHGINHSFGFRAIEFRCTN